MPQIENMKLYFIAGEASGDLHASNLIKSLKKENEAIEFRCWGGDKMKAEGVFIVKHIKELAFMGFIEVISNIRTILKNIRFCKEDIEKFKPDAIILVDYPGFNLRIAEWAKNKGIKVIYYISPQVWAWKQSRVHKIKRCVDKMFVILPFEKEFYERFDFSVEYLGHPLLDAIELYQQTAINSDEFRQLNSIDNRPIIAVLPGSRKQEVSIKLPIMLNALADFPAYQFIIAGAPSLDATFYTEIIGKLEANQNVRILYNQTYDLLSASEAAIVTSGTATLETALLEIPEVVCYKGSAISYHIAKRLIKIDYISLVNLIMGKEVVKELIQQDCNPDAIRQELKQIIIGGTKREAILENYRELKKIVGGGGASEKVAHSLLKTIRT
jgi:lipid-A-disaccharide synthase